MRNNKVLITSFFVLSIGLFSCGGAKEKETTEVEEKPIVRLAQVFERDVPQVADFTATIQPQVKNSIAPTTPGRIRRIMVDVGARVGKGQRLVQMDAVNLENYQTNIVNLRKNYNRLLELYEVGGVAKQDVDNMKAQLDQAEASMRNLKENTYLVSPISGVVTARNYDNGDMFTGQLPVLTVMQINPLKAVVNVSETYFPKVRTGMGVDISFDAFPNERFNGTVSKIYPTVDEMTRTFGVEIRMTNPGNKVRPGMYARVTMNFGTEKRVVVPDQAIVKQVGSGSRFVYVYQDGKVSFNEVKLGQRLDSEYELISGVATGSQVVVAGQSKLSDQMEVKLADEKPQKATEEN
ncbi:MAG: efflux RND transporter periplasmic adaptor subunit [Bacteroidales bacterium]|nr:efflux RND transporter periplasmic adaptor subunit [Bacteroidales bacterium]